MVMGNSENQKRTGNNSFQELPAFFEELYFSQKWSSQWELFQLVRDWPNVVGKQIAEVTSPAFFRKQVLCIYVDNSSWMQQVQYLQPELLKKVNQAMQHKEVTGLRWLLKPQEYTKSPDHNKETLPPQSVAMERCQEFREMVTGIDDETCRKALYNLWYRFQTRKS